MLVSNLLPFLLSLGEPSWGDDTSNYLSQGDLDALSTRTLTFLFHPLWGASVASAELGVSNPP